MVLSKVGAATSGQRWLGPVLRNRLTVPLVINKQTVIVVIDPVRCTALEILFHTIGGRCVCEYPAAIVDHDYAGSGKRCHRDEIYICKRGSVCIGKLGT